MLLCVVLCIVHYSRTEVYMFDCIYMYASCILYITGHGPDPKGMSSPLWSNCHPVIASEINKTGYKIDTLCETNYGYRRITTRKRRVVMHADTWCNFMQQENQFKHAASGMKLSDSQVMCGDEVSAAIFIVHIPSVGHKRYATRAN